MSNQPKITYRSDSTGFTYQMALAEGSFTIQAVNIDNVIIGESYNIKCLYPWRRSINLFFDIVDRHINTGHWS